MDQKRDELLYSSVKGKNPFKDKRVRQAFYQAIDIDGIKKTVMRGASQPVGIDGWPGHQRLSTPAWTSACPMTSRPPRSCMVEAGYPNGFEVSMNCPNDRYVNDGRNLPDRQRPICPKSTSRCNLQAETKGTYFPKVLQAATPVSTCWVGPPATYDAHNALNALTRFAQTTRPERASSTWAPTATPRWMS